MMYYGNETKLIEKKDYILYEIFLFMIFKVELKIKLIIVVSY